MPRQIDKHRNIEIAISEEAVEEALALWITQFHGIEVERKNIEIIKDGNKLTAKITKRARPNLLLQPSTQRPIPPEVVPEAQDPDGLSE